MATHITKLVEDLREYLENDKATHFKNYFTMITDELNLLDTSYIAPNHRYDFIKIRQFFRNNSKRSGGFIYEITRSYVPTCEKLIEILKSYGKMNSIQNNEKLMFITNDSLRAIVERDYNELTNLLMPDGAWKSAVILSGSILEAILFDQLSNENYNSQALNCSSAPKFKDKDNKKIVKQLKDWKLAEMITVAETINCLPPQRAKSIDQVLRDYRNFVHPLVEVKSQHPCTEAEAFMAKGALEAVINHFNSVQATVIS